MNWRIWCGTWEEAHTVSWPRAAFQSATSPRVSIGWPPPRPMRSRTEATRGAARRAAVSAGPWGAIWQGPHTYCFPILSIWEPNTAFEFWVAAWPVKVGPMFGPAFAQAA